AACTTQWDAGTMVTLKAQGAAGADRFVRWTGACTGRTTCSVTLGQAASVAAVFGPLRIPVRVSAFGRGRVACSPKCGTTFAAGEHAAPDRRGGEGLEVRRLDGRLPRHPAHVHAGDRLRGHGDGALQEGLGTPPKTASRAARCAARRPSRPAPPGARRRFRCA